MVIKQNYAMYTFNDLTYILNLLNLIFVEARLFFFYPYLHYSGTVINKILHIQFTQTDKFQMLLSVKNRI